jgi:hypothetical protein
MYLLFFKKSIDFSGPLVASKNHFSYQSSFLLPTVSQRVDNARINADEINSCRSTPDQECIPTSILFGNITSNMCHGSRKPLDACAVLPTEKQESWCPQVHPIHSPATIGLAFMKLPGLERMEISSCNVKTCENNKFVNGQSLNTAKCQK